MRVLATLFVCLAACSSVENGATSTPLPVTSQPTSPQYVGFLDETGNVALASPGGGTVRQLTEDASDQLIYRQPTWAPGGNLIAWTAIEITTSGATSEVQIAQATGGIVATLSIPVAPFYLYWSPDGGSLAALGSGARSIELWVLDVEEASARVVAEGQPFYFSWSPDSRRLLSHVSDQCVSLLSLDGQTELISRSSTGYQAPGWSDRDELAYVVGQDASVAGPLLAQGTEGRRLVTSDIETRTVRVVQAFAGFASLGFSPDGSRLAYSITPTDARATAGANLGPLMVTSLDAFSSVEVESDPVVLYQWGPNGEQLLYAVFSGTGLRWKVWDGSRTTDYGPFIPTDRFLSEYLPFWDQYALSSRLWSRDGTAFTYAGRTDERDAIFVQHLDADSPTPVADGSVAFWSP
ncbi:MAG: TolB family protein [Acidimicrobiia bacterium]